MAPRLRIEGPRPVRWAVVGVMGAGIVGCAVGLAIGLLVHWQTAWFATVEIGFPASIVGGLIGLASGAAANAFGAFSRR